MSVNSMQFPLKERIGHPDLFVERKAFSTEFDKWVRFIPKELSKSRALLARKKSGKTAYIQRLFNRLWSENGAVIPFYLEVPDQRIWYPMFAERYYQHFASQYISFLERDPALVRTPLSLEKIKAYGQTHDLEMFVNDVDQLLGYKNSNSHDLMWELAHTAPHRYAGVYEKPMLVLIDEFQNLSGFIYRDQACKDALDPTIPGAYHEHSESKIAPMLATGSSVGWLVRVLDEYLEAGRLSKKWFSPYLAEDEGLEAVYRYAEAYEEPITNETALLINELTRSDPYFISCVIRSGCPNRDLTTRQGVLACVNYEIGDRNAELAHQWMVYLRNALPRINEVNAKKMLLFLTHHADRTFTPTQLKKEMDLDLSHDEILERLHMLHQADLILDTPLQTQWQGYSDGTLFLVIQHRFQDEMALLDIPREDVDYRYQQLRKKHKSLQGAYNQVAGHLAEYQLAWELRDRRSFPLSTYFHFPQDIGHMKVREVAMRHHVQNQAGKTWELDLVVKSDDLTLLVEVKHREEKVSPAHVKAFLEAADAYRREHADETVVNAVLSKSGFTEAASNLCGEQGVGMASDINWKRLDW